MGTLTNNFGKMQPGQLITADKWNDMVAAVDASLEELQTTLNQAITDKINPLKDRVDALDSDFHDFKNKVEPILNGFYQLTLKTSAEVFNLGEFAEIEARVKDIVGADVTWATQAERPWIDFITTWGKLKPVSGFTAKPTVTDKALSVQVNAQGIAKVRVRAETVEGTTEEDEGDIYDFLQTSTVGDGAMMISQLINVSPTPADTRAKKAFQAVTNIYKQSSNSSIHRTYYDHYYYQNNHAIAMNNVTGYYNDWQYYPCVVFAFARKDDNPTTPDRAHGTASLQFRFRDWIGPWISHDFLEVEDEITNAVAQLTDRFTDKYETTAAAWKKYFSDELHKTGLLGRQRESVKFYEAVQYLKDRPRPPEYTDTEQSYQTLGVSAQSTLIMQQTLDASQYSTPLSQIQQIAVEDQGVAFRTISYADVAAVSGLLNTYSKGSEKTNQDLNAANDRIVQLEKDYAAQTEKYNQAVESLQALQVELTSLQDGSQKMGVKVDNVVIQAAKTDRDLVHMNDQFNQVISDTGQVGTLRAQVIGMKNTVEGLADLAPETINTTMKSVEQMMIRLQGVENIIQEKVIRGG